jgi:transposase
MPKPYSTDLRERAVEAVESAASRRAVAEMFKLGVSSVVAGPRQAARSPNGAAGVFRHWKSTRIGYWL